MAERRAVVLEDEARQNIDAIFRWIAERSRSGGDRWYRTLIRALGKLAIDAERLPIASESRHFDVPIRNLTFRMRSGRTYRVLFTIEEDTVHVLFIRAPGQDSVRP
jgi:plasmid stabilization system protein ParE